MDIGKFLIKTIIVAFAVAVGAWILPGVSVSGFGSAILVALALALLNAFIKPLLVIFTIPLTLFTLGLFLLVINALIILMADWIVRDGFQVDGFWWAFLYSILLSALTAILESFDRTRKEPGGD